MKILFITYSYWPPDFGGELLISIDRLQSLVLRNNWQVTVLTSGRIGFTCEEVCNGIHVLRSSVLGDSRPMRIMRRFLYFLWVTRYLLLLHYEILHIGTLPGIDVFTDNIIGSLFAYIAHKRNARVIFVYSLADTENSAINIKKGILGFVRRFFLSQITDIICVSPALFNPINKMFPNKAVLIPNSVRDDIFQPVEPKTRKVLRAEKNLSDEDVIFIFLGSVTYRKGFDILALAFSELAIDRPNWYLWIIGPRSRIESQNINPQEVMEVSHPLSSIEKQVKWLGRINDRQYLAQILGLADIFVFPSRREGMPIAPVEAMATGLPVIIARLPGITDMVSVEGETGLYIPPGDDIALKAVMLCLGENISMRKAMGKKAACVAQDSWGWEQHIIRWERLYLGTYRREVVNQ